MYNSIIKIISTFFFIGYMPFIPGTIASFIAVFFIWSLRASPFIYIFITALTITLGFSVASEAEKIFKRKDAKQIVIDEFCGMFLSLLFLPLKPEVILSGFILFRILDSLKAFPINRLENLSGGKGIMLDDILAGIYTNIILQVVFRFALCRVS